MNENVVKFFELYDSDPALRQRISEAEAAYPGSLEIRDAVASAVLLPVAEELGLPFTLLDLRVYETKMQALRSPDREMSREELENDQEYSYWLNGRGWSYSDDVFKQS